MRVLLLGSGGRESALAAGLARSSATELIVAPGNPGMAALGEVVYVDPTSATAVTELAGTTRPDLVVVGPEAPLVAGVGDALQAEGYAVFGPDAAAARIEGSKSYANELMERAGIPTGRAAAFTDRDDAIAFADEFGPPYVVKADGLAAGKGVVVTSDRDEAIAAIDERLIDRAFGDAGTRIVIEEFLEGQEASVIAFADGSRVVPCEPAQDYKRAFDSDAGPNTGGMGSYSPVPACPPDVVDEVAESILGAMVRAAADAGHPFVGALYAGLALTPAGPKVIEFNCRFGDPETQALIPRLRTDLASVCLGAAQGSLAGATLEWSDEACVSVVLASEGYPGKYETGFPITGVEQAAALEGVDVFHAGTEVRDGRLVTAGGRVLAVSALGDTYKEARARAYEAADLIRFDGKHMRTDIASRAETTEGARI